VDGHGGSRRRLLDVSQHGRVLGARAFVITFLGFALGAGACTTGASDAMASHPDPATAFLAIVKDPGFSGRYTLTGSFRFGTRTISASGQGSFSGAGSESTETATSGGRRLMIRAITANGVDYERVGDGPWLEKPQAHLDAIYRRLVNLDDLGIETRTDQPLHHLRPPPGFAIIDSDLGLQDSHVTELRGSIDFYVKDDGTPVEITLAAAWTQPEGKASGTETLQLSDLGAPISITPPIEVWKTFTAVGSGFAIASPPDWGSRERGGDRYFIGPSGAWVEVRVDAVPAGTTLSELARQQIAGYAARFGTPDGEQRDILGGQPAQRLTFHTELQGVRSYLIVVFAVRGTQGYWLFWVSPPGAESTDEATFDDFVSTFEFVGTVEV
jgi:hypothetical protein